MLAAQAGGQPADLDRAPCLQSRASMCQLSGLFKIGRVDDRVAAQRKNGAGPTNGAAVIQDGIALGHRASPSLSNHTSQAAAAPGLPE